MPNLIWQTRCYVLLLAFAYAFATIGKYQHFVHAYELLAQIHGDRPGIALLVERQIWEWINPQSGYTWDFQRGSCHILTWRSAFKGKWNNCTVSNEILDILQNILATGTLAQQWSAVHGPTKQANDI